MRVITIVGGGSAGLCSALILKIRFPQSIVKVIKSEKICIIGVGESTTEQLLDLMGYCQITPKELIQEADATVKLGVMFENWTPNRYFHNVSAVFAELRIGLYLAAYGSSLDEKQTYTTNPLYKYNELYADDTENIDHPHQFHLNTYKFNELLIKKCLEKGVEIIEDEILDVKVENDNITELVGEKSIYKSDFYIDCTGMKRLLISKLGAKWESYEKYFKLNEAISFSTEDTDTYNVYTVARAMKYGWMWSIPTYGRWGNGYCFDNRYINKEQAQEEVEKFLGKKIEIARNIKFKPGKVDKAWIGNCVAIGLSSNFLEPLEATSIGLTLNQIFLLNHYITNYTHLDIEDYNNKFNIIVENVRDFIFLHYMIDKDDTQFWKDIQNIEPPESLKRNLDKWKNRLPIQEDFGNLGYQIFSDLNFTSVLLGTGFWKDKQKLKDEWNSYSPDIRKYIRLKITEELNFINYKAKLPHKEFLDIVRKS